MTLSPQLPKNLNRFCGEFLLLLDRWNRRHALTAVAPGDRREELLQDSAVVLPWLQALPPGARVVDFGTGMGIPALLLAAARPDLTVLAVDRSKKKLAFVRQAALELQLANLEIHAGDAAELPPLEADLGVAKAVGAVSLLLGWWARHGVPGGTFLALKGLDGGRDQGPPEWTCTPHPYQLPTRGRRVLLEFKKTGA